MNSDEIGNLVRQVATSLLSAGAVTAYVDHAQAATIAAGLGALVSVVWSVVQHWGKVKVPESKVGGK